MKNNENTIANYNAITENDASSTISSTPGFGKVNFPDLFNSDIDIDSFILKLQTIRNLLEQIYTLITILGLPVTDFLNLTCNLQLKGNQSSNI